MKKDKKIGEYLGMKQENMAMLLRVTRTQWSMYEIISIPLLYHEILRKISTVKRKRLFIKSTY